MTEPHNTNDNYELIIGLYWSDIDDLTIKCVLLKQLPLKNTVMWAKIFTDLEQEEEWNSVEVYFRDDVDVNQEIIKRFFNSVEYFLINDVYHINTEKFTNSKIQYASTEQELAEMFE